MQTLPLPAQDDGSRCGKVHLVVVVIAALVQTVDPVASLFQVFQRACNIRHPNHWDIRQRSSCGARDNLGQSGGAALRNHHGGCARRVRRTDDRAQVVRIFDSVQNDMQAALSGGILKRGVALRCSYRDNSLMICAARGAVQMLAGFESDGYGFFPAQIDDFLEPGSSSALHDQHSIQRPAGTQGFPHGMDSSKWRHYDKGTVMSEPRMIGEPDLPAASAQEIPDKLYFRIGEVAKLAGIKPYVLRFWESEFPSLGPKKSGTGHRLYRRKDVEQVLEIKHLLYERRYTIEGARKFLDSRAKTAAPAAVAAKGSRRKSAAAASPKGVQTGLFETPPSVAETVRKELREILDLLK
jgi:DNA-binding transcriptional MerR regulator